jgi:predicted DNA-binding protein (UPF0251 family)
LSGRARIARIDDAGSPMAGVMMPRSWLYSGNAEGETFGAPGERDIPVRDDSGQYERAHRDSPEVRDVDPLDALSRDAGLGMLEAEVMRRQRAGLESNGAIAEALGLSPAQLARVVTSARKKLAELRKRRRGDIR